jgi:hypothetical protein
MRQRVSISDLQNREKFKDFAKLFVLNFKNEDFEADSKKSEFTTLLKQQHEKSKS